MSDIDYAGRLGALRRVMEDADLDVVLLSVGSDLPYFTGYEAMASERPTMLAVPADDDPVLFVPRLEAPRVAGGAFGVRAWGELEDPLDLVAESCAGARRVAIGDHTWSVFALGLQSRLRGAEWLPASTFTRTLRMVKDPEEVALLGAAANAVDRVLARVPESLAFAGRSEAAISRDLAQMTVEEGHDRSEFAIVASGPWSASPHHEPGPRVVEYGDLVVCDFGGRLDGYFSDVTRTFVVGDPSSLQLEIHAIVAAANRAARARVRPGVSCSEVDRAARQVIEDAGYGEAFIHRTGHGIGLEVHEHPYIVEGNEMALDSGMSFSIEPGIYLEGEVGVRIEDIVVCVESGVLELNRADRQLLSVS